MHRVLGILLFLWFALTLTVQAQEMHILQYAKVKKGPFNLNHVVVDKQQAILDLKTNESGFSFLANGKIEVAAEDGDGVLTLKAPDKTSFIVIKHSDYGQMTWKVPSKKGLRKKKHYVATLQTFSPDKEFKLEKQWVVFIIQPEKAILTVDSTMSMIHDGKIQCYLPLGKHEYLAESPFHQEVKDTFELTEEGRKVITVALQPLYSYMTVRTPMEGCDILIDGQFIGKTQGTSGHLREGAHQLIVMKDSLKYYDSVFNIGWREKKTIELKPEELHPLISKNPYSVNPKSVPEIIAQKDTIIAPHKTIVAPVTIIALDDSTSIWINRELKGYGKWEGQLEAGLYLISSEKDGLESRTRTLWINDETAQNVELLAPMGSYGMINVHSNEIGAEVYVNDRLVGTTPCVVKNMPAGRKCQIRLTKTGFYDTEKIVMVEGNDLANVNLKLKKKKDRKK